MAAVVARGMLTAAALLPWIAVLFFLCTTDLTAPASALNVGTQNGASDITVKIHCSRTCESEYCSLPPLLRYGKYCGILYSGCPGEKPCDGLDACCQIHDVCVQSMHDDYLSQRCNRDFLNCMERFRRSGRRTFRGNQCDTDEVVEVISFIIQAALVAGRALHRP